MLNIPAPFPQVGSYALFVDPNLETAEPRAELVRIMRREVASPCLAAAIAFPLRTGSSGQRIVPLEALIDATPLGEEETAELKALRAKVSRQVRPKADKMLRAEALRTRAVYADILKYELARLELQRGKVQPSRGLRLPIEERQRHSLDDARRVA